jgi:hypothetical protein
MRGEVANCRRHLTEFPTVNVTNGADRKSDADSPNSQSLGTAKSERSEGYEVASSMAHGTASADGYP